MRTVDEILRDAEWSLDTEQGVGKAMLRAFIGHITPAEIAECLTKDPAERAALVRHMTEQRGK